MTLDLANIRTSAVPARLPKTPEAATSSPDPLALPSSSATRPPSSSQHTQPRGIPTGAPHRKRPAGEAPSQSQQSSKKHRRAESSSSLSSLLTSESEEEEFPSFTLGKAASKGFGVGGGEESGSERGKGVKKPAQGKRTRKVPPPGDETEVETPKASQRTVKDKEGNKKKGQVDKGKTKAIVSASPSPKRKLPSKPTGSSLAPRQVGGSGVGGVKQRIVGIPLTTLGGLSASSSCSSNLSSSQARVDPADEPPNRSKEINHEVGWILGEVTVLGKAVWTKVGVEGFWWPAKIAGMQDERVVVELFVDSGDEVLQFSSLQCTVVPSPSTLLTLKTTLPGSSHQILRFPNETAAFCTSSHHPSPIAFGSALSKSVSFQMLAALDDDDELPDPRDAFHIEAQDEVWSQNWSQPAPAVAPEAESEEEEEEEKEVEEEEYEFDPGADGDLDIPGEMVMAAAADPKKVRDWWPAKVLGYDGLKKLRGRGRRIPHYSIEYCDGIVASVPRSWFASFLEEEYHTQPMGRIKTKDYRPTHVIVATAEAKYPDLSQVTRGAAGEGVGSSALESHMEFMGGGKRRKAVAQAARYGKYSEEQVEAVAQAVTAAFSGDNRPTGDHYFEALSDQERRQYCGDVLVPEVIRLITVDEHLEDAQAELPDADVDSIEVKERAEELAEQCLNEPDIVASVTQRRIHHAAMTGN